jgi:hypothetical protein
MRTRGRTTRIIVVVLALVVVWLVSNVFLSAKSNAQGLTAKPTAQGLTTYRIRSSTGICDEHRNGVLAGWRLYHSQRAALYPHLLQYRFGPWEGSYCSNGRLLWNVRWGGHPDGYANWALLWTWDDDRTRIQDQDKSGTFQFRRWVTRMHTTCCGLIERVDHPWLEVDLGLKGVIDLSHGCGC